MQEEISTTPKPPQKRDNSLAQTVRRNSSKLTILIIGLILGLGAWVIYTVGQDNGMQKAKDAALTSRASSSLVALPASGNVSAISDKEITVKLLGKETRKATIDSKTQVTTKKGAGKISDIKKDGKVILFTKKSGSNTIATKIIIQ